MGTPVKIQVLVQAQTEQADAQFKEFFNGLTQSFTKALQTAGPAKFKEVVGGGAGNLLKMREASMLAKEGLHGLEATVLNLAGAKLPGLIEAVTGARMAMMTMRSASMLTGLSLGTVVPVVGAIGAIIATGVIGWQAYAQSMHQAGEDAKKTAEQIKAVGAFLTQINSLRSAGAISPSSHGFYLSMLRGQGFQGSMSPTDQAFLERFQKEREKSGTPGRRVGEYYDPEALKALQDYLVKQGHLVPNKEKTGYELSPADEALAKIRELRVGLGREGLTDEDKKVSELADKYGKLTEAAKLYGAAAIQGGEYNEAQLARLLKQIDATEAAELKQLDWEKSKRDLAQADAAFNKRQEELAADANEQQQKLERELTLAEAQEGKRRGQNFESDYQKRIRLAQELIYSGLIGEKDYTALVQEATIKRLSAKEHEADETARVLQLQDQNAKRALQLAQQKIEGDPFKTQLQKAKELLPILQKQYDQIKNAELPDVESQLHRPNLSEADRARLTSQQLDLEGQAGGLDQHITQLKSLDSFQSQLRLGGVQMQNQWGNLAASLAGGAFATIERGVQGMAGALTSLIVGTKTAAQAFSEFGLSLITSFIQMILEAVLYAEIAIPILTALGVLSGGTTAATGAAVTAIALGSVKAAYAEGGRPAVGQLALVGERGPELFVPDAAGTILPANVTQSYLSGSKTSLGGADGTAPGSSAGVRVHNWFDKEAMMREIRNDPESEHHIVDVVGKNSYKFR